jgi:hypothetical protein
VATDTTFSSTDMPSHDLDQLVVSAIDRLMTGGISHEHDAFANPTPRELRAKRREAEQPTSRQVTINQSEGQDVDTVNFSDQSENEEESKPDFSSPPDEVSTDEISTDTHPSVTCHLYCPTTSTNREVGTTPRPRGHSI